MSKKLTHEELGQKIKELKHASNTDVENPYLVDGKYSVRDLIDIESLNKVLNKFSLATGFTTGYFEYPSQEIILAAKSIFVSILFSDLTRTIYYIYRYILFDIQDTLF